MARRFVTGPWPIHGLPLWLIISATVTGVSFRLLGPGALLPQSRPLTERLLLIAVTGAVVPGLVVLPLIAYQRIRRRVTNRAASSPEYLLVLLAASALAAMVLAVIPWITPTLTDFFGASTPLVAVGRFFVVTWFLNALLGVFLERIRESSEVAQNALKVVVHQRRLLLESEERVRSQVAAYLHDRVQTDLVSIGLRIRAIIEQSPDEIRGPLSQTVTEIERVRSQEVRRASRHLSPDIKRIGLETALRELAESYEPGMTVTLAIAPGLSGPPVDDSASSRATGLYRICEQGLLNSAVHGHASECSIVVSESHNGAAALELRDNGVGAPSPDPEPGTGMTVISAWVESLRGTWSLTDTGSGMILTANLSAP